MKPYLPKLSRLSPRACLLAGALALLVSPAPAQETDPDSPDAFAFSLDNMDRSVDPGDDFYRYAAGGWLDRVDRPANVDQLAFMTVVNKRMSDKVAELIKEAAADAGTAAPGTPEYQIGTLYNAYLDEAAIDEAGLEPLQAELDRLEAVSSMSELAAYLAHFGLITTQWPLLKLDVYEGITDASMGQLYVDPGMPTLLIAALYEMPEDAPPRQLFTKFVSDTLQTAGVAPAEAASIASDVLGIETMLHKGETDPVLMVDYRNWNNPRTIAELQQAIPDLPLAAMLEPLGLGGIDRVIVTNKDYPAAVAQVLDSYSLDQIKGFLKFRLVQAFAGGLSSDFEAPGKAFNAALGFSNPDKPRAEKAVGVIKTLLPQPLGKLYVDNYFDEATRVKGLDMVERIQAAFRARVVDNQWLDESTRAEALRKIDGFSYEFGSTDRWIDYRSVEIGDDMVQNMINANSFWTQRTLSGAGKPFVPWAFSSPTHTAPMVVNAAYNPSKNGFEVTAGMAQPPAFEVAKDAPVYFCRLGAIIGHEMTHGFDSGGRLFDHTGSMKNWFSDEDAAYFEAEAKKLVAQGDAYEALPGTFMKGGLSVKENLADIGGVGLAHDALMNYLAEHPEENVAVDGMSPSQRCFVAWAQLWAENTSEQMVRIQLEDNHPPGPYRTYAPLQHLEAFYDAFDIGPGDAMWLPPEQRVDIW